MKMTSHIKRGRTRLKVFENRMLKKFFDIKRRKLQAAGENCIMTNFAITSPH